MSKVHCNVIQDMIPLYVENICSDETRQMVDAHVGECEGCREMLALAMNPTGIENTLQTAFLANTDAGADEEKSEVAIYHKIRKQVFRKTAKRIWMIAACVVCIFVVGTIIWTVPFTKATYEQAKIEIVEKEKGVFVDTYIDALETQVEGDILVVSGKISCEMKVGAKKSLNMYRYYEKIDETIQKIVFVDRDGTVHELWEK